MRTLACALFMGTVCVVSAGCSNSTTVAGDKQSDAERTKQAVLRVMKADEQLSQKQRALPPNSPPSKVAHVLGEYCDGLEKLGMSDCPADFRVAYTQHIRAWRDTVAAIRQLPDGFLEGVFMGAINSLLRGESDGGQGRLEGDVKRAAERVRTTWEEVERIGAKYGAAL